jgi:hypothetical protein
MRHTAKRGAPEDMGDFGPLDLSDVDFRDLLDAEERKHIGSPAAAEEKRAISEVAVMKGLPAGITRNIGKFLGKSAKGGRKTPQHKTRRRTGGRRKTRRFRR